MQLKQDSVDHSSLQQVRPDQPEGGDPQGEHAVRQEHELQLVRGVREGVLDEGSERQKTFQKVRFPGQPKQGEGEWEQAEAVVELLHSQADAGFEQERRQQGSAEQRENI